MKSLCETVTSNAFFTLVFGLIQLSLSVIIILYLRYQRNLALRGDEVAAKVLVLPIYIYVLYGFLLAELLEGGVNLCQYFKTSHTEETLILRICISVAWGVYHFVFEGLAILLMQQGAGRASVRRAFRISASWGVVVSAVMFLVGDQQNKDRYWYAVTIISLLLLCFYSSAWILPDNMLHHRPALKPYALFWMLEYLLMAIESLMIHSGWDSGWCIHFLTRGIMFGILKPFVVYRALNMDSEYWQGMWKQPTRTTKCVAGGPVADREAPQGIQTPLMGVSLSRQSARQAADFTEQFFEYQFDKKDGKKGHAASLLNCAFLKVDKNVLLGAGGTCKVYRGRWQGQPVAVKMVFCPEITPSVLDNFSHEAALHSTLNHPNVVRMLGVCILPPAVSIVMELCNLGSLHDFIKLLKHSNDANGNRCNGNSTAGSGSSTSNESDSSKTSANGCGMARMSFQERLCVAMQCARGLAYLHSKNVVHLDIKSMNFLVHMKKEHNTQHQSRRHAKKQQAKAARRRREREQRAQRMRQPRSQSTGGFSSSSGRDELSMSLLEEGLPLREGSSDHGRDHSRGYEQQQQQPERFDSASVNSAHSHSNSNSRDSVSSASNSAMAMVVDMGLSQGLSQGLHGLRSVSEERQRTQRDRAQAVQQAEASANAKAPAFGGGGGAGAGAGAEPESPMHASKNGAGHARSSSHGTGNGGNGYSSHGSSSASTPMRSSSRSSSRSSTPMRSGGSGGGSGGGAGRWGARDYNRYGMGLRPIVVKLTDLELSRRVQVWTQEGDDEGLTLFDKLRGSERARDRLRRGRIKRKKNKDGDKDSNKDVHLDTKDSSIRRRIDSSDSNASNASNASNVSNSSSISSMLLGGGVVIDGIGPDTVNWTAPELLVAGGVFPDVSKKVSARDFYPADVYSLSMVLYEIFTDEVPFGQCLRRESEEAAQILEMQLRPELPASMPAAICRLLRAGWHRDPDKRPTVDDFVQTFSALSVQYGVSSVI